MMLALEMFRSLPRTVAGKAMGSRMPGILSGFAAPLRLVTIDQPTVDRPGWARLRTRLSGICGSDLGALSGQTSLYFSAVATELDGAERDEAIAVYSRVSEAQGLGRFTTEDVSGDGRWRLYRATARERSVLGPGDERLPVG